MSNELPPHSTQEQGGAEPTTVELQAELQALEGLDDAASLERCYELHRALIWRVWQVGTERGQKHAQQAVDIARKLGNELQLADALHDWGQAYLPEHGNRPGDDRHPTQKESRAAQLLHEEALALRERLLGPNHPDVAESLLIIVSSGRLWAPIKPYVLMAERAVDIYEHAFGPDHEQTCAALERLAQLLGSTRGYELSAVIYERLRQVYLLRYGPDDYHTLNSSSQLGWTYNQLGDHAAALDLLRTAHSLRERLLGRHDIVVLNDVFQISDLLRQQSNVADADAEIEQRRKMVEDELGPDHPTTISFLQSLASHYTICGNYALANSLYEQVIASYDRVGEQGGSLRQALNGLFVVLWRKEDMVEAQTCFKRLISPNILQQEGGLGIWVLPMLKGLRWVRNDPAAIVDLYEQLLPAVEQTKGSDHPDTAALLIEWAEALLVNEDVAAALSKTERALEISTRIKTLDGEKMLTTIRQIDGRLCTQSEYAAVRSLYNHARRTFEQVLGTENVQTIEVRERLGTLPE